jgi:hypothetical protein
MLDGTSLAGFSKDDGDIIKVPGDGNCLFTSMAVGILMAKDRKLVKYKDMGGYGRRLRRHFVKWVKEGITNGLQVDGQTLDLWLLNSGDGAQHQIQSMDDYITTMSSCEEGRHQWGSLPEVALVCHMWRAWAVMLSTDQDSTSWSMIACMGSVNETEAPICILWCGS